MAWEMRGRYGPYYTRSRKVGGRVVREYVGGGPLGQLAARIDAEERAERHAKAEELRAELARLDELGDITDAVCKMADGLLRTTLEAAGYHQHKRREWRRRREKRTTAGKQCE